MKKLLIVIIFTLTNTCLADNYFAKPNSNAAKLILDSSLSTKSLSPVKLLNINGKEINPRLHAVWLKPGDYVLKFSAAISNNSVNSGANSLRNRNKNANTALTVTLEADKKYYIAYDSQSKNIDQWQPVVWKVE